MITLTCKSFRVRYEAESVILEIETADRADLIPQLLTKADVAMRLAISVRKVETLAASGRLPVVRIDGCVRFRETDVLRLLTENQEPAPRPLVSALS
ncbi:MAG: helix-turn-helix domain-containing protein [Verrucomicrobiia bacterium]|jgi:excisionase family DNA binding protein